MDTNYLAIARQQLLSKEALRLPPRQRLDLLINAEIYPIVTRGTSAEAQIKEMIDFYNLCCLMLVQYLPNEEAEHNCLMLSIMASHLESSPISTDKLATGKLSEALKLLDDYEKWDNKITKIQHLFFEFENLYPDLYDSYNLEDIATADFMDIIHNTRWLVANKPQLVDKVLRRWGLLS